LAQARAIVLDTSLGDRERISALQAPRRRADADAQAAGFFDAQVIAAAIQLGTTSTDAGIRTSAWSTLRDLDNPSLVKPLLQVLAKDPDAQVRYQAAISLNRFLDAPGVREALRKAAVEDPSSQPDAVCCVLTVREAAQRSLVADNDYGKWVLDSLMDESLPVRSRLISLQDSSPDGRFRTFSILNLGDEAAGVVFDIGRRQQDAGLRTMAWSALKRAWPNDAFAPVLVEDMGSHANEYVRAAAATALARYVDRPMVRSAMERALDDPSMAVRRAAGEALAAAGR
jgi:HEAT repeat protein